MNGTNQVSTSRYNHVHRTEVSTPSNSLVSRMSSIVANCLRFPESKRTFQALLIGTATLLALALFTNPFGISLSLIATAFLVAFFVISALSMEFLGSNKKAIEGRPSIIQNDFIQECGQIDFERNAPNGVINNLYIDSLHEKEKNKILGEDLLNQIRDFAMRHPERRKDIIVLKNILIKNRPGGIPLDSYSHSLKMNLNQLAVDVDRGHEIRLEGELLQATDVESAELHNLEDEFYSPQTIRTILQSIEKQYPSLPLAVKNILVGHLHHGSLFDFEKDLNEHSLTIRDYANTNVIRNRDGSFSIEMDLLLKTTGDPNNAPLIPVDAKDKIAIAKRFGMVYVPNGMDYIPNDRRTRIDDTFFRSIAGTVKARIDLVPSIDKKYVRIGQIERSAFFEEDLEEVSLTSRSNSFVDEVHPPQQDNGSSWFSSIFKRKEMKPSWEERHFDEDTLPYIGSFSSEIGSRRGSFQGSFIEEEDDIDF